jgi:Flp pilus assembly protein TadD
MIDATSGRYAEAIPRLEQARARAPGFPGVAATLAYAYRGAGRPREAAETLAALRTQPQDARAQMNIALSYAVFGEMDRAFPLLAQAKWDVPSLIEVRTDPLLARLRSDARYPGLLRARGLRP